MKCLSWLVVILSLGMFVVGCSGGSPEGVPEPVGDDAATEMPESEANPSTDPADTSTAPE